MPALLLYSALLSAGAFVGSIINNKTEPSPIIHPSESTQNVVNSNTVILYALGAVGVYFIIKKVRG